MRGCSKGANVDVCYRKVWDEGDKVEQESRREGEGMHAGVVVQG